jgi:hypothetical protein
MGWQTLVVSCECTRGVAAAIHNKPNSRMVVRWSTTRETGSHSKLFDSL